MSFTELVRSCWRRASALFGARRAAREADEALSRPLMIPGGLPPIDDQLTRDLRPREAGPAPDAPSDGATAGSQPPSPEPESVRAPEASGTAPAAPAAFGDDELDAAISAAFAPGGAAVTHDATDRHEQDAAVTRELFASIAANHVRPVKNFIHELRRGTATKEWIEICQPVMSSIVDSAESLDLQQEAQRMAEFRDALALVLAQSDDGRPDDDCRELLLACYDELVEVLPETFRLSDDDRRRESIIIHSLLRQIPQLGAVTLERLYASGVTTLDALYVADPRELSDATGIPAWMCERICEKVGQHRQQAAGGAGELSEPDHRARLSELVAELRRQHEIFQRVSDEEDPDLAPKKRESLRNRQACSLQINVVLAEMGQVDLVDQLKKLAVERRIERLEAHLGAASEAADAAS